MRTIRHPRLACIGYESYSWVLPMRWGGRARSITRIELTRNLRPPFEFITELERSQPKRVRSLLVPRDTDTCSPDLLKRTAVIAAERQLPVAIHAAV